MAKVIITGGGGGGIDPDECTTAPEDVKSGKRFGGAGSDEVQTGTMPVNGGQDAALNCGQSKDIPAGYTPGGTVTANSLASQTGGATADDTKVLTGYTYWRDGAKRTGNLAVQSVVSFSVAQYSNLTLIASWAKPSRGPWSGLRIVCKQGGYPSNANDGTLFYEGSGTNATKSLAGGTWYFRAWNYITTNTGRIYGNYLDASANNQQIKGQQVFTSSGTFTVPTNVRSVDVFVVGGGGGGQGGWNYTMHNGHGGGGGYTKTATNIAVTPGQQIAVTIGSGGAGGIVSKHSSDQDGKPGGTSSFGSICSALGGAGPSRGGFRAGDGGSGGGVSGRVATGDYVEDAWNAGAGGADGSNGAQIYHYRHNGGGFVPRYEDSPKTGIGQHTTTRAFEESSGELYSGGGGGASTYNYADYSSDSSTTEEAPGGAGGGGGGSAIWASAGNGSANTGGGGGGGSPGKKNGGETDGGNGGSGIAIIRWGY